MPFTRPTLQQLVERAIADIEANLPGADARVRRSNLNVLARLHAGGLHGVYGYLDWLARQIPWDTAEAEFIERWASIWGVARLAATFAGGEVAFGGSDGAQIPAGTELRSVTGIVYRTDALAVVAGGTAIAAVTAATPGAAGDAEPGVQLATVAAIAGVDSQAVVTAGGLTGGSDAETDASLRARLLARIQEPPHGGADFDYVAWAREVPGVTRAWCLPLHLGLGTVGVTFVMDDKDGTIIPDGTEVETVQDYIDARRPVTADVTVFAPTAVPLDLEIELMPDTAEVRAAVVDELSDLLRREAEPGATILISHIREAISIAQGETDHVLVSPAANVGHEPGEIAVLGTITWAGH